MISPNPRFSKRRSRIVLMQHMQISPAFVFWSWCWSQGDVNSLALSLEHQGPSAPSDPRLSAALWAPCSEMRVHRLCAMQWADELRETLLPMRLSSTERKINPQTELEYDKKQLRGHLNLCANVLLQLWRQEGVRDELEQPLNGIQFDAKSGFHCQDHGAKKVTGFESLLRQH